MLGPRQSKSFTERCTIWQKSSVPGLDNFTEVAANIAYFHGSTTNFPANTEVGQDVVADVVTSDEAHFDAAETSVQSEAIIKNTGSVQADGTLSTSGGWYGQCFRLLAVGQPVPSRGNRRANMQVFRLRFIPPNDLPPGVS